MPISEDGRLLVVEGLKAGYGDILALFGVSLTVRSNEIIGVLGPNGAGKSSLLKAIVGLIETRGGTIEFDERSIQGLRCEGRVRLGIGYVPQGREIFSKLTVEENLLVGVYAQGMKADRLEPILEKLPELKQWLKRLGGSLSGGQQQILALGRALITDPRILLLDEPSEGIQPSIVQEIGGLLLRIKTATRLSIILVEQNLDLASSVIDRGYIMKTGNIVREIGRGDMEDIDGIHRELLA